MKDWGIQTMLGFQGLSLFVSLNFMILPSSGNQCLLLYFCMQIIIKQKEESGILTLYTCCQGYSDILKFVLNPLKSIYTVFQVMWHWKKPIIKDWALKINRGKRLQTPSLFLYYLQSIMLHNSLIFKFFFTKSK